MRRVLAFSCIVTVAWVASCGEGAHRDAPDASDAPVAPDAPDATGEADIPQVCGALRGECAPATRVGGFRVMDTATIAYADGQVLDGVIPSSVTEVVETLGPCVVLRRLSPACDPACGPGQVCGLDQVCMAYPAPVDAGTVSIAGLAGGTVSMTPIKPGLNYGVADLPSPPFDPGRQVTLSNAGSGAGDIRLFGEGFEPLDLVETQWRVRPGSPLVVRWKEPAPAGCAAVELRLTLDQHGASPAELRCLFEDTGEGRVPAEAVDALLGLGVSGFPHGLLTRRTVDSQAFGRGCVDFVVGSARKPSVVVEPGPADDLADEVGDVANESDVPVQGDALDAAEVPDAPDVADPQPDTPDTEVVADAGPSTCDDLPPLPRPFSKIEGTPGSEDFVFDRHGNLVNSPNNSGTIAHTTRDGQTTVRHVLQVYPRGLRLFANDDIVLVDTNTSSVVRVSQNGSTELLASGLPNPNGIAVGFDGKVYLSGIGIRRIDPVTKQVDLIAEYDGTGSGFDGISFSPDESLLHFNEEGRMGGTPVFTMPMKPVPGKPVQVAVLGEGSKLDGMTVDACGNIYVVYMGGTVWRVTPEGSTDAVIDTMDYISAVNFGSGVGGWERDHLYAMRPDGGLLDIDVGVPGKPEPHLQ